MLVPFSIPHTLQSSVRRIQAGKLNLHIYDAGKSDIPLLLIHGLGDEADTWKDIFLTLAEQRRVIALDLPGFGRSDHPAVAYTMTFYAQTVLALLDALALPQAEIIGSSMGAAIAQRLALARPQRISALTLIGGSLPVSPGKAPVAMLPFLTPGIGELAYSSLRRSQEEAYATLRPFYADLDALPAAQREFLRERVWARVWSNGQRRAFLSSLRWMAIERMLRVAEYIRGLANLHIPTHLIWGEHDQIQPPFLADGVRAVLPNAKLTIIPGSGHLPQQERPDALLQLLF